MAKAKFISWAGVAVWMAVIFLFSNQPATDSSELSSGITEYILRVAEKISPEASDHVDLLHHLVPKKCAFYDLFDIGCVGAERFKKSGVQGLRGIAFALPICVGYAATDELHQLLIPGRSGEVKDVLIDSTGALAGICLYLLVNKLLALKKQGQGWNKALLRT